LVVLLPLPQGCLRKPNPTSPRKKREHATVSKILPETQRCCVVGNCFLKKCYPKGFATLGESAMLRRQVRRATGKPRGHRSPRKIDVTGKLTVASVSVVTLIRTDTTLDHSQKAEKV
ncbi:MAG: hypothetical protein VXV91_08630, partial [Verrucomicrobiota bacterium]|nr:hypothetical protein [Verrucomicrobiota bacterium]